jgi:hypothetical protein
MRLLTRALPAMAACAALAACGSTSTGPVAPSDLTLPDADAGHLARTALDAWALGRSAIGYRVEGCSRADRATAECIASIEFADNPANPQSCTLAITVLATNPTVGVKEPGPLDPTTGIEIEQYALSNGGYGTYRYGDESGCDQAQHLSGF